MHKLIIILFPIWCLSIKFAHSQSTSVTFQKVFDEAAGFAFAVQEVKKGGYIVVGRTSSCGAGEDDIWLIKTDKNGNKLWDRTFGGSASEDGLGVRELKDGNFIIIGNTMSFGAGEDDIWLIKTDKNGNKLWDKTFGGKHSDTGYCVQELRNGEYIVVGKTCSFSLHNGDADIWLIKIDKSGNKLWDKTFGGKRNEFGHSVTETKDGGFIITGWSNSFGINKCSVWLIKTDEDGNELWNKIFGGEDRAAGDSVQETKDGGFIIAGMTWSFGAGLCDAWLIKTDKLGNRLWDKTFGGRSLDIASSVQELKNGGFIIAGEKTSLDTGKSNVWLIKTDRDGNKLWEKIFGGKESNAYAYDIKETTDGGFIIAGFITSHRTVQDLYDSYITNIYLIKTDENGECN